MPKYSDATLEAIESVLQITKRAFPVAKSRFMFWKSLAEHLNVDEKGRVSFRPILVAERRRAVIELFDGENVKEIAKSLNITVKVVYDDIADHYANREHPAPK